MKKVIIFVGDVASMFIKESLTQFLSISYKKRIQKTLGVSIDGWTRWRII